MNPPVTIQMISEVNGKFEDYIGQATVRTKTEFQRAISRIYETVAQNPNLKIKVLIQVKGEKQVTNSSKGEK